MFFVFSQKSQMMPYAPLYVSNVLYGKQVAIPNSRLDIAVIYCINFLLQVSVQGKIACKY